MKVGDSVKLLEDVTNHYLCQYDKIEGFEGRVFSISGQSGEVRIQIEFDSISLRQMTDLYIRETLESEIDYACIDLSPEEVVKTGPRDTPDDVKEARKEIAEKYGFVSIIDDGPCDIWEKKPGDEKNPDEIGEKLLAKKGLKKLIIPMCIFRRFLKVNDDLKKEGRGIPQRKSKRRGKGQSGV